MTSQEQANRELAQAWLEPAVRYSLYHAGGLMTEQTVERCVDAMLAVVRAKGLKDSKLALQLEKPLAMGTGIPDAIEDEADAVPEPLR